MTDMREYKGTILEAVKKERDNDINWSWRVNAVNKKTAHIGWGYLDYSGESTDFTVRVEADDDEYFVIGAMPCGERTCSLVGEHSWDDATTVEEGIAKVIRAMARTAHNGY